MKKSKPSLRSLAGMTSQIGLLLAKQGQAVIDLQNKHIKSLGAYTGDFTPSAVKEALICHNDLASIDDLDRFKELRRIIANNNYISRVRLALDRLETLDLSNNALTTIPNLVALPKLKVLNLLSNNIREVSIHFLPVAECLEKLNLAQNQIDFYSPKQMSEWIEAMNRMQRLEELSVKGNPFNDQFRNYKGDLFEAIRSLMVLDGEKRREILKDKPEIAKEEDEEIEIITKQWKTGGQQAKRLVEVSDLVSVFNLLLHSVEMINYDRAHALEQMHELSNFIDEFIGFYKDTQSKIRKGDMIKSRALIVSFAQNVQLIVDEITQIRSPILYNLCKLAIVSEGSFGEKCLNLLNDFMQVGSNLQAMTKELIINQLIPQVDNELPHVYQPVVEGLVKMVQTDGSLADYLTEHLDRFKEWLGLIMQNIQTNVRQNNELCNSAIRLIGMILKDNQNNVNIFLEKGFPAIISEVLSSTKHHGGSKEREIALLVIVQNCCNTVPTSAAEFIKVDLATKIAKPILELHRDRKKSIERDPDEDEDDVLHYVKHIDAFSALLTDHKTLQRMMESKISPIPNLISVLYFCKEDALVITTVCNMAIKIISNSTFIQKLDYVEDFLEWMNNAINLLEYFKGTPYEDVCNREGISDTSFVALHNPKIQKLFISIVNLIGIISEKSNEGIDPFEKASMALNECQRETLLFSCLQIPSDDVKLAVVKCLYNVKIEEFDKEEINTLVDMIKTYKNVGAGQTEKVLSYIFYIFGKLTYALIKKNIQIFEEQKIKNAFFDCLDIMYRNQRRSVEGQIDEAEERTTLSVSCVYFMQSASRVMNISWRPTQEAASSFVKVLNAEERYFCQTYPQPIQIEQTWMGKHLRFLLKALTDSLTPFTRVSLRIIQRIADLLQNKPQRRLRDPLDDPQFHSKLFDDILRSQRGRYAKEYMSWMSGLPGEARIKGTGLTGELPKILHDSEAFVQWTQQHRTFVDYGIELILMFLEGKIKRHKKKQFADQITKEIQEALSERFSTTVERYVKECEEEEAKRVELMEKKEKNSKDQETKLKRVQIAPSELVRQHMRSMRLQSVNKEEQMFTERMFNLKSDQSQEYVLSVAAMLRCFYVALEKAPIPETRETTIHLLQQYYVLKSIITLCKRTGWIQGYVGVKFMKVVSHLLYPSTESGLNTYKMLNILDQVSASMREILGKVNAILVKERQNQEYERSLETRNFFFDVTMIGWILVKESTAFNFSEVKIKKEDCEAHRTLRKPQFKTLQYVLTKIYGIEQLKTFLEIIMVDQEDMNPHNQNLTKRNKEDGIESVSNYSTVNLESERSEIVKSELGRFYVTQIVGEYLDKCPSYKFQILDILLKASIFEGRKIRKSFIQEILNAQKRARLKSSLFTFLHKPKISLFYDPARREKIHCSFYADLACLNSNQFVKRIVVLTNLGIYILKPPKGETCPLEGGAQFCRSSPTLTASFNFEEIDEIIQFPKLPYQLMFKIKSQAQSNRIKLKSNQQLPAFYLMRFDLLFAQKEILTVLQNLSIFSSFDYYNDEVLFEAIKYKVNLPFEGAYYVSYNPQSGFGLFNFLKDPVLIKNCQIAVISADYIFIFTIDWEKWLYLGYRQTINQKAETNTQFEAEEAGNEQNKEVEAAQETRTAWEIAIQKRKQKSIQHTLKLKAKIPLQISKLIMQTTTDPLLRIESGSNQYILKFGCDFGREQFQADVKRAMANPPNPYP